MWKETAYRFFHRDRPQVAGQGFANTGAFLPVISLNTGSAAEGRTRKLPIVHFFCSLVPPDFGLRRQYRSGKSGAGCQLGENGCPKHRLICRDERHQVETSKKDLFSCGGQILTR